MKRIVDLETWSRRENFLFFKDFVNPVVSVTSMVPCHGAFKGAKARRESFFLTYLHAILKAVNEIEEFHYRVDNDGNVVYYDRIDDLSPIRTGESGFVSLRFSYCPSRSEFIAAARAVIDNPGGASAYSCEKSQQENDLILVSAVPGLAFTSMGFTQRFREGNPYPLLVVGKMTDDFMLPVAVSFHHGFVDGEHVTRFYDRVAELLAD